MSVAFISHPLFAEHEVPTGHPECRERMAAIIDELHVQGLYPLMQQVEAPAATREQLERVHAPVLVDALERAAPKQGFVRLDPDTWMGPHSLAAAKHAAGACVRAADLVLEGKVASAFCCVRPPGHHAERATAMGFCLFNNIAVGAAHALEHHGLERVAIVDFDVHHGNGTEAIFERDPRVLICSSYQHPFYPHTGTTVRPNRIVNVPLAAGTSGHRFREAVLTHWQSAMSRFEPQLIFVSAGFDAHVEDPLAELGLTEDDYAWVTDWLVGQARQFTGRGLVSSLEGGYALRALGRSVAAHLRALLF